jgi:hypothetical protein
MNIGTSPQAETETGRWDLGSWPAGHWWWTHLTSSNVDVVLAAARRLGGCPGVHLIGAEGGAGPAPLWAVTSTPGPDARSFARAVRQIAATLPARESASFAAQARQSWRYWTGA